MRKRDRDINWLLLVFCTILAFGWLLLVFDAPDTRAFRYYILIWFLPLTASPYIMWVMHREGQEPDFFNQNYPDSSLFAVWFIRIFMMVIISVMCVFAAIIVACPIVLAIHLFDSSK
jgi:hypothetical protein